MVSPVLQPSLGGLPPLLIMTGGGEILRDEQIYLAHKCANPTKYPPPESSMHESAQEQVDRFKPTDVQLQVWDDLCHVAPTLSFTHPAKFMYRSIAQFGAWALARAQKTDIEIQDDDSISVISGSSSSSEGSNRAAKKHAKFDGPIKSEVGRAGDPLPPFKNHMIRQQVNRHGVISPLPAASELPSCKIDRNDIGVVKETPVRRWLETRSQWDKRYGSIRARIHKQRLKEMIAGYVGFDGETPPPASLASRRKPGEDLKEKKKTKSMGLALWSLWGSKHDEATVLREQGADKTPEVKATTIGDGHGARSPSDLQRQAEQVARRHLQASRSRSRTKVVKYEQQISDDEADENYPASVLAAKREEKAKQAELAPPSPGSNLLTPDYQPETGVTGKRPVVGGIAVPFSLDREADTASMITLTSMADHVGRVASPLPLTPRADATAATSAAAVAAVSGKAWDEVIDLEAVKEQNSAAAGPSQSVPTRDENARSDYFGKVDGFETPRAASPGATPIASNGNAKGNSTATTPLLTVGGTASGTERPPLETFVTAQEDLPVVK